MSDYYDYANYFVLYNFEFIVDNFCLGILIVLTMSWVLSKENIKTWVIDDLLVARIS